MRLAQRTRRSGGGTTLIDVDLGAPAAVSAPGVYRRYRQTEVLSQAAAMEVKEGKGEVLADAEEREDRAHHPCPEIDEDAARHRSGASVRWRFGSAIFSRSGPLTGPAVSPASRCRDARRIAYCRSGSGSVRGRRRGAAQ
jgi:hypothetical protein